MSYLDELAVELHDHFEAKDRAREASLRLSRSVIRSCSASIRSVHREEFDLALEHMGAAQRSLAKMREVLEGHPDVRYAGFFGDAEQEYAEARLVHALITGKEIPGPRDIGVEPVNYLTGLGDVTGELRRHVLDLIRRGRPSDGEFFLETMEDIYQLLMTFDYPDAMTRGLRRKGDLARSMLERTRGDLTNAMGRREMELCLGEMKDKLKGSGHIV